MPLHVYLRRTNVYSPSYVPPLISFLSSSTLPLKELIHVKRPSGLLEPATSRNSAFMVQSAVRVHVPVHVPQPISSTEDPTYRCQSANGAPQNTIWGTPNSAEPNGGQQDFMCKNRWCSEKPGKRTPKLTTLLIVDHAEINILCSDHDSKQTKRGFSTLAALFQKLQAIPNSDSPTISYVSTFMNIAAENGSLLPFAAREDV